MKGEHRAGSWISSSSRSSGAQTVGAVGSEQRRDTNHADVGITSPSPCKNVWASAAVPWPAHHNHEKGSSDRPTLPADIRRGHEDGCHGSGLAQPPMRSQSQRREVSSSWQRGGGSSSWNSSGQQPHKHLNQCNSGWAHHSSQAIPFGVSFAQRDAHSAHAALCGRPHARLLSSGPPVEPDKALATVQEVSCVVSCVPNSNKISVRSPTPTAQTGA